MESIINTNIANYLRSNNLLHPGQHGFISKKSTCTQLIESVNDWSVALDSGKMTDIIYIDFAKAFDTVSHKKLVHKIRSFGISGTLNI